MQQLEVSKGDWVIVDPRNFKHTSLEVDTNRMLAKSGEFIQCVRAYPKAPRRRDTAECW